MPQQSDHLAKSPMSNTDVSPVLVWKHVGWKRVTWWKVLQAFGNNLLCNRSLLAKMLNKTLMLNSCSPKNFTFFESNSFIAFSAKSA